VTSTSTTSTSVSEAFVTVPGDRHSEVARTLAEPVPQALSALDQLGLWGNLGVSLLGFTGAIFVLQPGGAGTPKLSLAAGLTAIVLGTVLGTLPVALAGLPGTRTGAPAMVLLRGLFGARLSYLPTALNILQCLGWGIFELVTIATAAHTVAPALPRWAYILVAGVATAALTLRPLGAIRILRRYVTAAVVIVLAYLFIQLLRHPLPPLTQGAWGSGFWVAMDTVVAAAISFAPLAADYTRHSRSQAAAFNGAFFGYGCSATSSACSHWSPWPGRATSTARSSRCPPARSGSASSRCASWTSPSPTCTRRPRRPRTCARSGTAGCWRSSFPP
jgi:nucleobase:cation symporter-1, NCS1 family